MCPLDNRPQKINRIVVFGLPGSGKSTFSTKLSKELELPIIHLDKHFFVENWGERDYQEFLGIQQEFVDQQKWIIDGNAMKSLDVRFQKADMAIYFRYPILICLWRIMKRVFNKNWPITDLPEGCKKNASLRLIKYLLRFHKSYNSTIKELSQKYPHVDFFLIKSDRDLSRFLSSIRKEQCN